METNFKIDKNIPIPESKTIWNCYPFKEMKIGDSFEVKNIKSKTIKSFQNLVYSSSRNYCKTRDLDWKFITAITGEDTVRIWRIK